MKNLAFAILSALLLAGCIGRYSHKFELDEKTFDADAIKEIEKDSGIVLPSDARGLNFYYWPPIDPAFAAKIEISAKSKDEMLKRISQLESKPINSGALGARLPWWTPTRGNVLVDRQSGTAETHLRAVLTEEDGRTFLYLEWMVM